MRTTRPTERFFTPLASSTDAFHVDRQVVGLVPRALTRDQKFWVEVGRDWLLGEGNPPHSISLTDKGRQAATRQGKSA